jgi:hypothetical protein
MSLDPDPIVCDRCGEEIEEGGAFCAACGTVAAPGISCATHEDREAIGACVVCGRVVCDECVDDVGGCFLCADHADRDVVDGLVRVFSGADEAAADVGECLGQAGLHVVVTSVRAHSLALLTPDRLPPELEEEPAIRIEIRVPCAETAEAERLLSDFGFLS